MNINLKSTIIREDINVATIKNAQLDLNADLEPRELKVVLDIGGQEEVFTVTGSEMADYITVSLANNYQDKIADKIDTL